ERVDIAVEAADHEQIAEHCRAAGPPQRVLAALPQPALPLTETFLPERVAARGVDRLDRAVDARGVEASVDDGRCEQCTGIAGAVADALAPDLLHLHGRSEFGQRRRR